MQSQQKRVKWSRGETAEALEERTDTGITQASVERMENCIPDIYGNISRRPGLSLLPFSNSYNPGDKFSYFGFTYDAGLQFAVFYITEDDIILIGIHTHSEPEFLRIKNGKLVAKSIAASSSTCWNGVYENNEWTPKVISYAQQNNYMIIATALNTWKIQFPTINDETFTHSIELWKFSAGWYAPEGTETKKVTSSDVTGLNFNGGFSNYEFSDGIISTVYSQINTGVSYTNSDALYSFIPAGSIIQLANIGCYFRVEGYTPSAPNTKVMFPDITFDGVLNKTDTVPATGTYCKIESYTLPGLGSFDYLVCYVNGSATQTTADNSTNGQKLVVKNSSAQSGLSTTTVTLHYESIVSPTGTHYIVNGSTYSNWANASNATIYAYGAVLTPVADNSATDSIVSVETGYTSLQPESWSAESNFPHPKKVMFNSQRLWAGGWAYSVTQEYALVIGSQIARYNDLKNDYNQENEPITLDILTQFKERIIHIVDYNGLKVFTDAFEYAYDATSGLVKQSSNGAYENCTPLVFESLCLYVDATGNQVKAMQYEFQSNIFNSSSINQLAPHDLVWYPYSMAAYEDKIYSTGKYLFLVNKADTNIPRIAVCNFVPSNQANIWSRWTVPNITLNTISGGASVPLVDCVIHTKKQPIFMVNLYQYTAEIPSSASSTDSIIYPAVLDFNANADIETSSIISTQVGNVVANVTYVLDPGQVTQTTYILTTPSLTVGVYSDGVFQFNDTLTAYGALTKDISGLTNVTVGLPINATIVSHPIDVGGKTKSIKKRIAKTRMSVHNTNAGAITINGKTGYMNPAKDMIDFYGVTGMKDEIKYTITNNNGAAFHLESLLMNIEYGTLIS